MAIDARESIRRPSPRTHAVAQVLPSAAFGATHATANGMAEVSSFAPMTVAVAREGVRGRILVVDDNENNQKVASRMLEKLGCTVDTAWNGRQALEQLQVEEYDLIFMDIQMPEMDGYEATAAIRRLEDESNADADRIPIVALTANALREDRERCLASGLNDFVTKPIRREVLETILARWI